MNFEIAPVSKEFYSAAAPIFILSAGGLVLMLQSVIRAFSSAKAVFFSTVFWLAFAILSITFGLKGESTPMVSFFSGTFVTGTTVSFAQLLILGVALAVSLAMKETFIGPKFFRGEITSLFMMLIVGMLVMVSADDLITMFVGLELASIGIYPLIGYTNPDRFSQEGAIKYFVLGSVASAILLFGFAFLYASTGTMQISTMVKAFAKIQEHPWLKLGALLTAVGFAFKMALVPFHLWAPDAYEAAPTGITAFMATTFKVMIVVSALRFFSEGMVSLYQVWLPALSFVAMLSMVFGNILALVQSSLKRMLAYSSIAHSGYMAVAICALAGSATGLSVPSVLFYLLIYTVVTIGSFAILMWFESEGVTNLTLDDMNGLAKKYPKASFALAVFLFSLGGMPPTAGFIAKFFVFNAALSNHMYSLVVIGVVGSSISLYYYLRVIVRMYMSDPVQSFQFPTPARKSLVISVLSAIAVIFILLVGTVLPSSTLRMVKRASTEVMPG